MFFKIMLINLSDNTISLYSLIFTAVPVIGGAILWCKKVYEKKMWNKKEYPSSVSPEIKYFTNREEITKEIFDTMYKTNHGEVFTIYGPAGIGKSEFIRLINLISNPSMYNKSEQLNSFVRQQYSANIEKKSQSYIFDTLDSTLSDLFKQIYEAIGLDYHDQRNFESITEDILKKIDKSKQVLFIFENISDNEFASQIYEFFKVIDKESKKTKIFFFCVYSSNLRPELANTSIKKELKKLNLEQTEEFLLKHDLDLNQKKITKIYKLTNGNLTLLKTISKIISLNPENESDYISNSKDIATLFTNHLKNDKRAQEMFIAFLSFSISHNKIDKFNVYEILDDRNDKEATLERLINAGFLEPISGESNHLYSISSKIRPILYANWHVEIIDNQKRINNLIRSNQIILNDSKYVHFLFDTDSSDKTVIQLKKGHKLKNYSLVMKIFNLFDLSSDITEYLKIKNPNFETVLYYIVEGLIGAGNYSNADKIIHDSIYENLYNIRNQSITSSNFEHHFLQGNLYHLQNRYEDALNIYQAMLQSDAIKKNIYYQIKVLWGLGHVNRHLGNLELANNFYTDAIQLANRKDNEHLKILVKCMNEQNSIFMFQGQSIPNSFDYIDNVLKKIKNKPSNLSTNKYKAISLSMNKEYKDALELIDNTLTIYEENLERLRFNLYFEKAEILRLSNKIEIAILFYKKSLDSSEYNGDKNIQLYSLLGILCCELRQNKFYVHKNKEKQQQTLFKCHELCYNNDEICFNLGLKHIQIIKQILEGGTDITYLDTFNLPLF